MKRQLIFHSMACAALATACLASCSLDPYEEPAVETYTKSFIKTFGLIDSEQNWNMATRASVTVSTPTPSNVKVYAKDKDGQYSIVADYDNVSGERTLGFDVASSVKEVLVANGSHSAIVAVGGSVNFAQNGTRTIQASDGSSTSGVIVEASTEDPKIFSKKDVVAWESRLPEDENNQNKVTANFHASSADGAITFTMYPIFWKTGNGVNSNDNTHQVGKPNEVGIAWKDDDGNIVRVPVYSLMEGDELQGTTSEDATNGEYVSIGKVYPSTSGSYEYYKSKGIKVTVPQGLDFCFYIKCYDGSYDDTRALYGYSKAEWNDGEKSYVGTYTATNGTTYLTFEDWITTTDSRASVDLNDFVMTLDPAPTIIDEDNDKASTWILAGEDLGNTGDFDFNDMVISVKHVSGKAFADITALAAGGTLPIYLLKDGTQVGEEFHTWFGDGSIASTVMINTGVVNQTGKTVQVAVDENNFTMSSYGDTGKMGGFSFKVTRRDGNQDEVTVPQNGAAPQIICVPGTWQWPKENVNIADAYTGFGDWGANYQNENWIDTVVSDQVLP